MCYLAYNALLGVQITLIGVQSSLFGVQARNKLTIRQYVKSTQAKSARNLSGLNYIDSLDESKSRCDCPARASF